MYILQLIMDTYEDFLGKKLFFCLLMMMMMMMI